MQARKLLRPRTARRRGKWRLRGMSVECGRSVTVRDLPRISALRRHFPTAARVAPLANVRGRSSLLAWRNLTRSRTCQFTNFSSDKPCEYDVDLAGLAGGAV